MKFNATAKTNKISGCQQVCVARTGDGNYRGTWSSDCEDAMYLMECLDKDENVVRYSINVGQA